MKKYKSIIKLNSIEVLIYKALIDSVLSHDEFVFIYHIVRSEEKIQQVKIKKDKKTE